MNSGNSDLDFLFESDKKLGLKAEIGDINPMNDLMDS